MTKSQISLSRIFKHVGEYPCACTSDISAPETGALRSLNINDRCMGNDVTVRHGMTQWLDNSRSPCNAARMTEDAWPTPGGQTRSEPGRQAAQTRFSTGFNRVCPALTGFDRVKFQLLAAVWLLFSVIPGLAHAQALKRVEQADFGRTRDGAEVKLITLRNSKGMSAQIITYGAIIKELQAPDRDGNFTNILLTTDSLQKFERGFNGAAAVIGRVANRIAGAQFELDGTTYKLAANDKGNTIHGGRKGFAQSVWTIEDAPMKKNESSVKLVYLSKDGEEGFPGNLKTSVTYALTDNNELRVEYEAETDKATIVNLTNHAYWNLAGGGSCLDNILWIPSESYTPADGDLIPTGEIRPLKGTLMDFKEPTRIGDRIEQLKPAMNGYDHNYILGKDKRMKMAARLVEPKSGRILEVRTTQPAVQLYTANHLGRTAVCLETQHYPDAIHHKSFPSIVVRPAKPLKETTVFTFLAK
jgi:aldose 1-epimerase